MALVAAEGGSCDEGSVLVLYNSFSQPSMATAAYYLKARSIPGDNTFDVKIPLNDPWLNDPNDEVISREEYVTLIRDPLQDFLESPGSWTRSR